jgi:predicted nucleic acid-binding protein
MTRVFLDANVMFSAAWRKESGVGKLWHLANVQLVTSPYALAEAQRNIALKKPSALERLDELTKSVEVSAAIAKLTDFHGLPDKDHPILEAAVGTGCGVLLTGDVTHFGRLIGEDIEGVQVLTVSLFFRSFSVN